MPLSGEYVPDTGSGWEWAREQAERYERSGGTEATTMNGLPVVLVTSVGARSGKLRKNCLMRVEHDGEYALVASKGGASDHPDWYHNLKTNPRVELQDGQVKHDYTAREATGAEYDTWWQRAVEAFGTYAEYQDQTDRHIPVFVLSRS